jgi:hypothetical protein
VQVQKKKNLIIIFCIGHCIALYYNCVKLDITFTSLLQFNVCHILGLYQPKVNIEPNTNIKLVSKFVQKNSQYQY